MPVYEQDKIGAGEDQGDSKMWAQTCDVWGSSQAATQIPSGAEAVVVRVLTQSSWGRTGRGNVATASPYLSQCLLLVLVWQQMASYWSASQTMRMM